MTFYDSRWVTINPALGSDVSSGGMNDKKDKPRRSNTCIERAQLRIRASGDIIDHKNMKM